MSERLSLHRLGQHLTLLPRPTKLVLVLALDVLSAWLALWAAFYLRLEQIGGPVNAQCWVYACVLVFVPIFIRMGLYRAIFRYVSIHALVAMGRAMAIYTGVLFVLLLGLQLHGVPRSVGLIQPLVFVVLAGLWRVLARQLLRQAAGRGAHGRLLIYGAGAAGVQTAAALRASPEFVLTGMVDSDPQKIGRFIHGLKVIAPEAVADFVRDAQVSDILLAIPSLGRQQRQEILAQLQPLPAHVRTLPSLVDLATGRVGLTDFQELEIEDLLGRESVLPDADLLAKNLRGKVVLITGAGGSIGSELCRQIVQEQPQQVILLEHNEFGLYAIHHELERVCRCQGLSVELTPVLASIRNLRRLRAVFAQSRPDTVFHAAAYKHVPLVQCNPAEGIINNIFGTLNTARAAIEVGVASFVLISTDKAVRPTNVMGASKRMAELCLQALASSASVDFSALDGHAEPTPIAQRTNFSMVRFGNVLGSSGSVVPLFRQQLKQGGPLTVTHAEVTRYFMTIPEAAQLVLQAGTMAQGGEVFVLDMGQPVKIIDLARRMVELSGLQVKDAAHPHGDIEIQVVGLRPGEKLYEELLIGDNPQSTSHPRIMKAHEEFLSWAELLPTLLTLRRAAQFQQSEIIHAVLQQLVSGYASPAAHEMPCTAMPSRFE